MKTAPRLLLAVLSLLAANPAPADEVAEARAQYEKGSSLFHAGKYREAIAAFEAAYRLKPHGALHFNVAQCREKLGEWPAALRSYQDYLRELPEARDRAAVRASMVRIEQRLAGAGVQELLVYTDPPGAALRIDGKARGRTPFHITLPPGGYRLALSLEGFAPEEQEVEVSLAASRLVEVVLRPQAGKAGIAGAAVAAGPKAAPVPAQAPAAGPAPTSTMASGVPVAAVAARPTPDLSAPPPAAAPLAAPAAPPAPPEAKPSGWTTRRILAWTAAAVAVAAAGVAVSQGLQAEDLSSQLKDGTVRPTAEADALARDATSKARSANVLYGVGAAAAAAGTTLFILEGKF